jgi:RimJ/RimL family protein N-acetyltransferase
LQSGHPGNCELGYVFRRTSWGLGYATEAGALLLDAAFQNPGILVVDAYADADNVGSQRVMEKLGMQKVNSELRIVKGRERIYFHYAIARTQHAACPVLGVAL